MFDKNSCAFEPFFDRGFVMISGALGPEEVAAFLQQLEDELSSDPSMGHGEGRFKEMVYDRNDVGRLSLRDRKTWPTGKKRRVVECAPFPHQQHAPASGDAPVRCASHWEALRRSPALVHALDRIVGLGCWEMPFNGESTEGHPGWKAGHDPRHWYFPIVFPEHEYPTQNTSFANRSGCGDTSHEEADKKNVLRKIELHSWRDELSEGPFTSEALDAPSRWQPVSRRRFRGKGWHIDVGPGFPNDGIRHEYGHPFQCVVLLLLLTDSEEGGGGTVMIPGSHLMVAKKLRTEEAHDL